MWGDQGGVALVTLSLPLVFTMVYLVKSGAKVWHRSFYIRRISWRICRPLCLLARDKIR